MGTVMAHRFCSANEHTSHLFRVLWSVSQRDEHVVFHGQMNSRFDRTVSNNNKKQQYNIGYIKRKNVHLGLAYYDKVHRGDKRYDFQNATRVIHLWKKHYVFLLKMKLNEFILCIFQRLFNYLLWLSKVNYRVDWCCHLAAETSCSERGC